MAYSTLVWVEKTIDQILNDDRFSISPNLKQQIISLDKYVTSFRAFLEDFPEKCKKLEARIRDVAMEAEDIIEWFMNEELRHYIFRYIHCIAELRRVKFEFQLHKVRDEMDSISMVVVEIKSSILIKDVKLHDSVGTSSSSSSSSSSWFAEAGNIDMVGLNEDLIEIMDRLCGDPQQLQILPITGMGGIGKTTLARNAYDDPLIMEHFHIRAWVTVSQDYSKRRILLDLIDSMKESMAESSQQCQDQGTEIPELSNDEMEEKVYRTLIGRRFLVVMDDVWSTQALHYAKMLFPDTRNGSRIMLTTRLADVAAYAHSHIPSHEMHLMDLNQSWHLLWRKVSAHQDHIIPLELENIGKEIARSCGGLPLAIVVVAGVLSTVSRTRTKWEEIARNVKSTLATTDGQIGKILSLSYNNLPHHLRPCFLYMGGFPEDHQIKAMELIRLWIAEGFVEPTISKRCEDVATQYLEDLVERSLIVVTKRKSNGRIKSCSLHDMVREMCIKLAQEEKFLVHISSGRLKSMKGQRRVSISRSNLNSFATISSSTIRTMFYFQDTLGSFGSLRLLRVLDMLTVRFTSRLIPDQFFELFHLRYLALCYDEQISRAILNLQSLQTLIIKASMYRPLPHEIWNMPQLRHLIIAGCWLLSPTVPTLPLHNLQTLGKVKNLICSIDILNMVPNLKKLRLTFFRGSGDLLLHNLVNLCQLEKLQLELETHWPNSGEPKLLLPSSLKKLTLIGWGHYKPYINITGPFPNLEVLKLIKFSFERRVWTTTDGDFPQLKYMLIDGSNLVQWDILSNHFPKLRILLIRACWRLYEIPYDFGEIATLEQSMAASARKIQEEKRSYGDDAFQVRCVDCEDINEIKELEFTQRLESVRKPKKVLLRQELSYRKMKRIWMGYLPYPKPRFKLDETEAELKIVDYKDAELQL